MTIERLEVRLVLTAGWIDDYVLPFSESSDVFDTQPESASGNATSLISGIAFLDINANVTREPGEPILPATRVTLTGAQSGSPGAVSLITLTAADGSYSFSNLSPGNYTIAFQQPQKFPIAGVVADAAFASLATDYAGFSPTFQFSVPDAGGAHWDQVNFVVPDVSMRAFLASTPRRAPSVPLITSLSGVGPVTFVEDGPPVPFAPGLTIEAPGTQRLQSATIVLRNPLNAAAERLAVDASSTSLSAEFDQTASILRITGKDTVSNFQKTLRSLTYENTSQDPDSTPRLIEVTVSDSTRFSEAVTATIFIQPVNDSPDLAPIANQIVTVNQTLALTITGSDPEARDVLTFQLDPRMSPLSATIEQTDNSRAVIHWTPTQSDLSAPVQFRVLVTDNSTPPYADSEQFEVSIGPLESSLVDAALSDHKAEDLTDESWVPWMDGL